MVLRRENRREEVSVATTLPLSERLVGAATGGSGCATWEGLAESSTDFSSLLDKVSQKKSRTSEAGTLGRSVTS